MAMSIIPALVGLHCVYKGRYIHMFFFCHKALITYQKARNGLTSFVLASWYPNEGSFSSGAFLCVAPMRIIMAPLPPM